MLRVLYSARLDLPRAEGLGFGLKGLVLPHSGHTVFEHVQDV